MSIQINFPWDSEMKGFPLEAKPSIDSMLDKYGYSLVRARGLQSNHKARKFTVQILERINSLLGDGSRCPWTILISNDATMLKNLGLLIPTTFAYSTALRVLNTSTVRVGEMHRTRLRGNRWPDEISIEEELRALKKHKLVWWSDFIVSSRYFDEAPVYDIIMERRRENLPIIFTHYDPKVEKSKDYYKEMMKDSIEAVGKRITNAVFKESDRVQYRAVAPVINAYSLEE